jgi:hypothetical protein
VWFVSEHNRRCPANRENPCAGRICNQCADGGSWARVFEHPIKTVWVIVMENQNWSSIKGNKSAPYMNQTLLPMASRAEQYFNPPDNHPGLPNYLWIEAGTNFGTRSALVVEGRITIAQPAGANLATIGLRV